MTEIPQLAEISGDYQITMDELRADVELPSILFRLILMLGAIVLNAGLIIYLMTYRFLVFNFIGSYEIAVAVITALIIFGIGFLGGKFWILLGYKISTAAYRVYLGDQGGKIYKLFSFFYVKFTDPNAKVYLEARAKDPKLTNPLNLFKLIFNISISQISFFMVGTAFLARPLINYLSSLFSRDFVLFSSESNILIMQNTTAMGISVALMALYIPMNHIMKDSNIRTWNKDLTIGQPSSKIRGRVDKLIGISALFSGWGVYLSETNDGSNRFMIDFIWEIEKYDLAIVFDYAVWLGSLLILSWPLIVPASIYYFSQHQKVVNKFRAEASIRGVPIGVSVVRLPKLDESTIIENFKEESYPKKEKKNS